ncbi:uncharacterized protein LOC130995496 [Salvia miltiorrhiza]|uniref:uncharacterized protein LOC130995496 n=1 Tax=Salvia miltiorrhiza TaxID=226208 RepID=UPI0025AD5246|nr:uncharacterized protein LOC130995496 [Salvia miltiorrhiza]
MRRSLGGGGGGGRGMGGGMIRTFQRAVKAGVGGAPPDTIGGGIPKKLNNTSPNTALTLFSPSFSSTLNLPAPAPAWISSSSSTDGSEWEYVEFEDETVARGLHDDYVFGTVPSTDEVHHAVSALQQAVGWSAKVGDSEMDWIEPSQHDVVSDAFHLLETEPSVQRMVVSLSSDQAVWDAVLNNEVVRELRGSIHGVVGESDGDDSNNILGWVVRFAKGKIMQLLDLITKLVNSDEKKGDGDDGLDVKVRSSFFLSLMVLLVVILARTKTTNA